MNSNALQLLEETRDFKHLPIPRFCGSASALAQCLHDPFQVGGPPPPSGGHLPVTDGLSRLRLALQNLDSATPLGWKNETFEPRSRHLVAGVRALFEAALGVVMRGDAQYVSERSSQEWLDLAISKLGEALQSPPQIGFSAPVSREGVAGAFQPHTWSVWNVATEVAWHVLEQWGVVARAPGPKPLVTVRTPVLAAETQGTSGALLWLTVDLFDRPTAAAPPGQLIPDLCGMGLTAFHKNCLDAFTEVWQQTQLWRWVRGVWRLDGVMPSELAGEVLVDAPPTHAHPAMASLGGPSAQAAMLLALLAATGAPDDYEPDQPDRPPFKAEPLCLRTAISARVDWGSDAKSIRHRTLLQVGQKPKKASAASDAGLQTAVFCRDESLIPDYQEAETASLQEKQTPNAAGGHPYRGLWVERASTVEEALELLLERNKYLREYQGVIQNAWDSVWLAPQEALPRETSDQTS
jgi:hypothetical protein